MLPTFLSTQSLSSSSLVESGMEGMAAKALKTSLWSEMSLDAGHEAAASEDIWVENVIPVDGFFVDDLLDFSKKDEVFDELEQQSEREEEGKCCLSVSSARIEDSHGGPVPELNVPAEEVEQLEWLSDFVEESFSQHSLPPQYPNFFFKGEPKMEALTPNSTKRPMPETTPTPLPAMGRNKRFRTETFTWSPPSGYSADPDFIYHFQGKPKQQQQRKKAMESSSSLGNAAVQRRCSHCGVQKTPQWRQGPNGDKTLCNACGVRYKSGRLLPEYRPACSPTFSSGVHSNNHRKVLEMRRKKEMIGLVQSF